MACKDKTFGARGKLGFNSWRNVIHPTPDEGMRIESRAIASHQPPTAGASSIRKDIVWISVEQKM